MAAFLAFGVGGAVGLSCMVSTPYMVPGAHSERAVSRDVNKVRQRCVQSRSTPRFRPEFRPKMGSCTHIRASRSGGLARPVFDSRGDRATPGERGE